MMMAMHHLCDCTTSLSRGVLGHGARHMSADQAYIPSTNTCIGQWPVQNGRAMYTRFAVKSCCTVRLLYCTTDQACRTHPDVLARPSGMSSLTATILVTVQWPCHCHNRETLWSPSLHHLIIEQTPRATWLQLRLRSTQHPWKLQHPVGRGRPRLPWSSCCDGNDGCVLGGPSPCLPPRLRRCNHTHAIRTPCHGGDGHARSPLGAEPRRISPTELPVWWNGQMCRCLHPAPSTTHSAVRPRWEVRTTNSVAEETVQRDCIMHNA